MDNMMHRQAEIPRVSVILPVFNNEQHLSIAIQSVIDQEAVLWECLIVDDGSTDTSLAIALSWQDRYPDRIRVLQHPNGSNRGVAASRNLALRDARGVYVAFLDSDDLWYPEKLQRQVAYMDAHPDVGGTYTLARIIRDEQGAHFIPGTDILGHEPPRERGPTLIGILNVSINYIFSSVMIRAVCLNKIGLFDENLTHQCEDRILVAKLSAITNLALIPKVLCDYHAHGASYTADALRAGIIPAIFFEMQTQVAIWLAGQPAMKTWTRLITHHILPETFVPAFLCSQDPKVRRSVLSQLTRLLRTYPTALPLFAKMGFIHSRVGAYFRGRKIDFSTSSHE